MAYDQTWRLSPVWIACYGDEGLIGKVKDMAIATMPRRTAKQVMKRYIAYACICWHRQLVDGV